MTVKTTTEPALFADVTLPVAQGGFAAFEYMSTLFVSDRLRAFYGPHEGDPPDTALFGLSFYPGLHSGETKTVSVELPREPVRYAPCFSFNAWDWAGHWQSAQPLCLDIIDFDALLGEPVPRPLREPEYAEPTVPTTIWEAQSGLPSPLPQKAWREVRRNRLRNRQRTMSPAAARELWAMEAARFGSR